MPPTLLTSSSPVLHPPPSERPPACFSRVSPPALGARLPQILTSAGYLRHLYYFSFFGADSVLLYREIHLLHDELPGKTVVPAAASPQDRTRLVSDDRLASLQQDHTQNGRGPSEQKHLLVTFVVGLLTLAGTSYVNFRTSAILRDIIDTTIAGGELGLDGGDGGGAVSMIGGSSCTSGGLVSSML